MKIKTRELIGPALDWAVARCEGLPLRLDPMSYRSEAPEAAQSGWWVWFAQPESMIVGYKPSRQADHRGYSPSTSWAQGGPIIERESITLRVNACVAGHWAAFIDFGSSNCNVRARQSGPTPLIAAMRCYVASKLGDEVDVPEEMT